MRNVLWLTLIAVVLVAGSYASPDAAVLTGDRVGYGTVLGSLSPPSFSCRAVHTAPSGGTPRTFDLVVTDFLTADPVSGIGVETGCSA